MKTYYGYGTPTVYGGVDGTWMIISLVLAIVGGIVAYIMFISKKNNGEYTGFVAWLHEFLNFKKHFIELILKVTYAIFAIYITLSSFSYISVSIAYFFLYLVFGNVILRLVYELVMFMITIVNNTTEINKKLGTKQNKKDEK